MELAVGTKILYTSAAGTRSAVIRGIKVGPTAKPGFMNTWLTLDIPVQRGVKFASAVQIPGDNASLKMFKISVDK
jgi:hypothetical protein